MATISEQEQKNVHIFRTGTKFENKRPFVLDFGSCLQYWGQICSLSWFMVRNCGQGVFLI